MRASVKAAVQLLVAMAALSVAGCGMFESAQQYDGATPGTVPGHIGEPSGPLQNGLTPEPWGSTS